MDDSKKKFSNADGVSVDELIDVVLSVKNIDVFNNRGRDLSPERFLHYSNILVGDSPELHLWYQIPLSYQGKLMDSFEKLLKKPLMDPYASIVKKQKLFVRYACAYMMQIHPKDIDKVDVYNGFLLRCGEDKDVRTGYLVIKEFTDLILNVKTKDIPTAIDMAQNIQLSDSIQDLSPYKLIVQLSGTNGEDI